jgi:hypothetical protein
VDDLFVSKLCGGRRRATQIVEKAKKGKKLTVREYLFLYLYLLSEDYKNIERRIKREDAPAGGRWAGAP